MATREVHLPGASHLWRRPEQTVVTETKPRVATEIEAARVNERALDAIDPTRTGGYVARALTHALALGLDVGGLLALFSGIPEGAEALGGGLALHGAAEGTPRIINRLRRRTPNA